MRPSSVLLQAYREHVARSRVQDGVFREIEQDRNAVPFASVITQCRVSNRAGTEPSLRIVIVYANTKRPSVGLDCSST